MIKLLNSGNIDHFTTGVVETTMRYYLCASLGAKHMQIVSANFIQYISLLTVLSDHPPPPSPKGSISDITYETTNDIAINLSNNWTHLEELIPSPELLWTSLILIELKLPHCATASMILSHPTPQVTWPKRETKSQKNYRGEVQISNRTFS